MRFCEYKEKFLHHIAKEKRYSEHTLTSYLTDLSGFEVFVLTLYEITTIPEITDVMVRSWVVSLKVDGRSVTTINRKISTLKSFFKWMKKTNLLTIHPMDKIKTMKKPKRLPTTVKYDKITYAMASSIEDKQHNPYIDARDSLIVALFYQSGMRRAELTHLSHQSIDLDRGELKVLGKGRKERRIPLTPTMVNHIKKYLDIKCQFFGELMLKDSFFCTEKGSPIYDKLVYRIVRTRLQDSGVSGKASPHVLRHSFATHLLDNGAEINAIKDLLGHSNLAATQVYTHNSIAKLKEVYQKAHPRK